MQPKIDLLHPDQVQSMLKSDAPRSPWGPGYMVHEVCAKAPALKPPHTAACRLNSLDYKWDIASTHSPSVAEHLASSRTFSSGQPDPTVQELASKGEVALESKDIAKLLGQTFLLKRCAQLLASSAAASAAELAAALSEQKYNQDIVLQDLGNSSDEDSGSGTWGAKSAAARTEAGRFVNTLE